MDACTRRSFMKGGALALFALGGPPRFLARAAFAQGERGAGRRSSIAVFQRGAVDGLSMIVPHGDPDYYAARGNIAIARPAAGRGRRHHRPRTASSACTRRSRRSSRSGTTGGSPIVHACGSPDTTRSHFDAQDYMESGTPGVKSTADGWLARGLAGDAGAASRPRRSAPSRSGRRCRGSCAGRWARWR